MANNYRYLNYVGGDRIFENRFATTEEMKALLTKIDISDPNKHVEKGGMPFISDTSTVYADVDDYHTLVLGSTGSMKTRTFILPTILTLATAEENMVISDPKGEIFEKSSGFLAKHGYEIRVINIRDMRRSDCWNPFEESYHLYRSGKKNEALNLAKEFIHTLTDRIRDPRSPSWASDAALVLEGLTEIMIRGANAPEECNPGSLPALLYQFQRATEDFDSEDEDSYDSNSLYDFVMNAPRGSSILNNLQMAIEMTKPNGAKVTLSGILDSAGTAISPFSSSRDLMDLTSRSTFDIHAVAKKETKIAIFLIVPDEDSTYHFLVSTFIKRLYNTMIQESYLYEDGCLPRRLNFILDEFANIPMIQDMPAMITAARSRNMRFFLVVQSDNQLHSVYEKDAETIKTNCLNWVYLSTKEDQLINQIQRMVGNRGHGSNEPLISYQELSAMRKVVGEKGGADALILLNRSRPYVSFMPDISRYKQFEMDLPNTYPTNEAKCVIFDIVKRAITLSPREIAVKFYDATPDKDEDDDGDDGDKLSELFRKYMENK